MPSFTPQYIDESLDRNVFNKLRIRYIVALSAIAICIIYSASLVQKHLKKQLYDSRIINVAGRQRMLSQKIAKCSLLLSMDRSSQNKPAHVSELESALSLWITSHDGLLYGSDSLGLPDWNSPTIDSMFNAVEPFYLDIVNNAKPIILLESRNVSPPAGMLQPHIDAILASEPHFLKGMDKIVFQYDHEARQKVNRLIITEVLLLSFSLTILLFELIFIFTPIARHIRNIIAELIDSETKEKKMNKELRKLYEILEASQKELRELYYAVDQAIMFARTDRVGNISFLSDKFELHLNLTSSAEGANIFRLLSSEDLTYEKLDKILQTTYSGKIWKNEVLTFVSGHKSWLMMTIVPVPDENKKIDQLVIVCTDINERKQAEEQLKRATRERYKRQVAEQKAKSSLILEGQETERRRIAREIHDGIGQLLTGLKFQLESIDWSQYDKSREKIENIKLITTNIIREVRRVSYNLAPSVLNDYGFVSALRTIVNDLQDFTKSSVALENITDFNIRLKRRTEINIFRIIQEALNNALKHSEAENILIALTHDEENLVIIIEDDGKGFAAREFVVKDIEKMSGRGIFNMRERASFIDASMDVETSPGKGTTIKIELPYKKHLK